MMLLMLRKTHDEIIEHKNQRIRSLDGVLRQKSEEIDRLEKNKKISKSLTEKNRKEKNKELQNLKDTLDLANLRNAELEENLKTKNETIKHMEKELKENRLLLEVANKNLDEARDKIVRMSKMVKKDKKTYSEIVAYTGLKREKKGGK